MCTAISYNADFHYFGRNLDLEYSFDEVVIITPREYEFVFLNEDSFKNHFAIVGVGIVRNNYPLYFDATNEKGLSIAGLNFPDNAKYYDYKKGYHNISPFELIPWILGKCSDLDDVKNLLSKTNIINVDFSDELKLTPLHWQITDKNSSITLETTKDGIKIYDNPTGVLTNNPRFEIQMFNLNNYMSVTNQKPENDFSKKLDLFTYSNGMGGIGLPGDLSSSSRFVRAVFTKFNSVYQNDSLGQFFHILNSVYQQRGLVELKKDVYEITTYSTCYNTDESILYYKTYENMRICAVDMKKENLNQKDLITYPMIKKQDILYQN